MSNGFFIYKSLEEDTANLNSLDELRIAFLEMLALDDAEGYFYLSCNDQPTMLMVDNLMMVVLSDLSHGRNRDCTCVLESWGEIEYVCKLFLNEAFEQVYAFMSARRVLEFDPPVVIGARFGVWVDGGN